MSNHKCGVECVNSKSLFGLSIMCKKCLTATYLGCIENNKEVKALVKGLAIEKLKKNADTTEIWTTLSTLFSEGSMFTFECPECCIEETKKVKESQELEEKLQKENNELKHKLNQILEITGQNTPMETDDNETTTITKNQLKTEMQRLEKQIVDKVNILLNGENGNPNKRRRQNDTLHSVITITDTPNKKKLTSEKRELLKPVKMDVIDDRSTYEIYISKFSQKATTAQISDFIMENTNIKSQSLFKIERLQSMNTQKVSMTSSFKVTTLQKDIYETIMDKSLWEPDFEVREFLPERINKFDKRTNARTPRRNEMRPEMQRDRKRDRSKNRYTSNRVQFSTPKRQNFRNYTQNQATKTPNFLLNPASTTHQQYQQQYLYRFPQQYVIMPPQQQQYIQQTQTPQIQQGTSTQPPFTQNQMTQQ